MRRAALLLVTILIALPARRAPAQVQGEIRGRVVDAGTSQPIARARVEVAGGADAARTDADGDYVIRGLEPREYTLHVRALGYEAHDYAATVANGRTTTLDVALEPAARTLEAVTIRAVRRDDSLPPGATTFDRRAIEDSHRRDVGELLRGVPGVTVTQAGGPGAETHVSIRGSSANEVLVLIDGVPANSAISGDFDFSRLDLESVERVTVLTGAQSARYGSRALAGVVAIDTRRPQRDASLEARGGSWGERGAATALGETEAIGSRTLGAGVSADYRAINGDFPYAVPAVRGGGTARRSNADVTSRQVLATASIDDGAWTVRARGAFDDLDRGIAGSIVQPSLTGRGTQSRASGGLDAHGTLGRFSWSAAGDATDERATATDTAPPFGSRYGDTVHAAALTGTATGTVGMHWLEVSAGGEARSMDVHATALAAGAGAPHWQRTLGAWTTVRAARPLERFGARLDAELGARVDRSSLDGAREASPRATLGVSRGALLLSGSVAGGYAPPSLADQFFHEGVLVKPNPSLSPERTHNDLEARAALAETAIGPATVAAQGAVFRADVDGMILWMPDFRFVWSPSNVDVHRSGWELNGRLAIPAAHVDVQGNVDDARVDYAGPTLRGQVAYRPRTTGTVTVGVAPRPFRLELSNAYVGARRTVPGSALNSLDAYWRTDARLTATLGGRGARVDATLGVENLFDRPAAMLVDYPFPSRTWSLSIRVRRDHVASPL